jgi:hypothetical protein
MRRSVVLWCCVAACHVLSCIVLLYPILSHPILSHPRLSFPFPFCPVLPCLSTLCYLPAGVNRRSYHQVQTEQGWLTGTLKCPADDFVPFSVTVRRRGCPIVYLPTCLLHAKHLTSLTAAPAPSLTHAQSRPSVRPVPCLPCIAAPGVPLVLLQHRCPEQPCPHKSPTRDPVKTYIQTDTSLHTTVL